MRPNIAGGRILQFGQGEKTMAQFLLAAFEFEAVRQEIDRRRSSRSKMPWLCHSSSNWATAL